MCLSVPANTAEKNGRAFKSEKASVLESLCFFFSALSVNIIKDVALVYKVRLACFRHSVQKLHGKAGKNSLGGKEKKDCDVRLSVSTDFGGYKERLFSAAPGKHKRAAQCSGVTARRGLVQ